jgi:hypothetical protein
MTMLSTRISSGLMMVVAGMALMPAIAAAQVPLQLNVPYRCQDGVTRTITRCERNARAEVCFWREQEKGGVTERYNVRSQMDGWLSTCTAEPPQTRAAAPPAAVASGQPSQGLNPPYLSGFPSVNTVKRSIQGSTPADTLARQIAVLNYLPRIIQRMQMVPGRRYNSTTPDEQRLIDAYSLASYELSQSYVPSAAPQDAKAFQQTINRYEMNPALSDQMFGLLSPATLAEFGKIDAAASAQAQARIDQQRRENEQARAAVSQSPTAGGRSLANDPGAVAMRRCLELGGSELECLGKGLTTGFTKSILGVDSIIPQSTTRGVRIGGTFKTASGLAFDFDNENANINACGKLQGPAHEYSVTRRGDQLQVEIMTEPKPLVVLLGLDGRFTGPAVFDLSGDVIVGYNTYWVESRTSDNVVVPGSGHQERVPVWDRKIERCGFSVLRPTGPAKAEVSVVRELENATAALAGQGAPAPKSETAEAPAGPRFAGTYVGAGGLRFEFHATAVIVDCGDAHAVMPYAVQNFADRLVITVRGGSAPASLGLQADGTLRGSGSIDVTGRVVTGTNANGVTFAPRTARCAITQLTPQ